VKVIEYKIVEFECLSFCVSGVRQLDKVYTIFHIFSHITFVRFCK